MGLFDWFKRKKLSHRYEFFEPKENIWYHYISYRECGEQELEERNLLNKYNYAHPVECWEIRPLAFINRKKHKAKFKVVGDKCIIEINKKRRSYPLDKCSFAYKFKYYHHKKINAKKRKDHEGWEQETPSGYGEYYVTVLVKD